jgi:hypothetical protein
MTGYGVFSRMSFGRFSSAATARPQSRLTRNVYDRALGLSAEGILAVPVSESWIGRPRERRKVVFRRFGAKPDKKICRRSGGEPEFMEDATHGRLDGIVVEIDWFWVVCAARGAQWLSGSEQGFDGFVAQDEERCHRPEAGQQRLVAASVADPADDVFAAEFLQIISGVAGTVQ